MAIVRFEPFRDLMNLQDRMKPKQIQIAVAK